MQWTKSRGLIAATLTPFHQDGSLNLEILPQYMEYLNSIGVHQAYVNGTSAEHASLTVQERKLLAERWTELGSKHGFHRIIIHVGAGCLSDTRELAAHAQECGAHCIAAIAPTYYVTNDIDTVVEYMREVAAAAPDTPFMYYHFPVVTKTTFRLTDWLLAANDRIPTLIGAKCTSLDLYDAACASRLFDGKFDIPVGADHQQLGALAMGLPSGIGISYSFLGRVFNRMIEANEKGDADGARKEQELIHRFWSATRAGEGINPMIADFKNVMTMCGVDVGPPRLPILTNTPEQTEALKQAVEKATGCEGCDVECCFANHL